MIKYFLYLLLIFCVIKIFRFKLNSNNNIIYATLSIFIGIVIINWLIPKYHKMTQYSSQEDDNQEYSAPDKSTQKYSAPDKSTQKYSAPDQSTQKYSAPDQSTQKYSAPNSPYTKQCNHQQFTLL